jgi:hypothetical protein
MAAAVVSVAFACVARPARADVTSWLSASGGATSIVEQDGDASKTRASMRLDLGVGSRPTGAFVVGGLVRTSTYFGAGTDMGTAVRLATGGFARGTWGVALDAGVYSRAWGTGSWGGLGSFAVGGPFGLQVSLDATRGSEGAQTLGAFLGVDLLRLTAWRTSGLGWFPNPSPAVAPAR